MKKPPSSILIEAIVVGILLIIVYHIVDKSFTYDNNVILFISDLISPITRSIFTRQDATPSTPIDLSSNPTMTLHILKNINGIRISREKKSILSFPNLTTNTNAPLIIDLMQNYK